MINKCWCSVICLESKAHSFQCISKNQWAGHVIKRTDVWWSRLVLKCWPHQSKRNVGRLCGKVDFCLWTWERRWVAAGCGRHKAGKVACSGGGSYQQVDTYKLMMSFDEIIYKYNKFLQLLFFSCRAVVKQTPSHILPVVLRTSKSCQCTFLLNLIFRYIFSYISFVFPKNENLICAYS